MQCPSGFRLDEDPATYVCRASDGSGNWICAGAWRKILEPPFCAYPDVTCRCSSWPSRYFSCGVSDAGSSDESLTWHECPHSSSCVAPAGLSWSLRPSSLLHAPSQGRAGRKLGPALSYRHQTGAFATGGGPWRHPCCPAAPSALWCVLRYSSRPCGAHSATPLHLLVGTPQPRPKFAARGLLLTLPSAWEQRIPWAGDARLAWRMWVDGTSEHLSIGGAPVRILRHLDSLPGAASNQGGLSLRLFVKFSLWLPNHVKLTISSKHAHSLFRVRGPMIPFAAICVPVDSRLLGSGAGQRGGESKVSLSLSLKRRGNRPREQIFAPAYREFGLVPVQETLALCSTPNACVQMPEAQLFSRKRFRTTPCP